MKVGLLGQGATTEAILDALRDLDGVELVAVGDAPGEPWAGPAHAGDAKVYNDYRSLIVEQPLDLLIVAGWVSGLMDYLELAASRHIPVFRTAPPNRSFERFLTVLQAFEKHDTRLEVSRPFCNEFAYRVLSEARAKIGTIFLGRATIHLPAPAAPAAQNRLDDRGLLLACYEAIDLIVLQMGVPEMVFANIYDSARLGSRVAGETADTAVVTFRYASGASAVITAGRVVGPAICEVRFDGPQVAAVVASSHITFFERTGQTPDVIDLDVGSPFRKQLSECFSCPDAAHRRAMAFILSHLPTMTVIETAILSSKTGQAESLDKLLQQHGIQLDPAALPFLPS